jgi:hypothetical protein
MDSGFGSRKQQTYRFFFQYRTGFGKCSFSGFFAKDGLILALV